MKVRRRATYEADKAQPSSGTICAWPLTHTDRGPVRQLSADWLIQPPVGGALSAGENRNSSVTGEDGPVTSIVSNIMFCLRGALYIPKTILMCHSLSDKDKMSCFD